jgi:hypothetical protein
MKADNRVAQLTASLSAARLEDSLATVQAARAASLFADGLRSRADLEAARQRARRATALAQEVEAGLGTARAEREGVDADYAEKIAKVEGDRSSALAEASEGEAEVAKLSTGGTIWSCAAMFRGARARRDPRACAPRGDRRDREGRRGDRDGAAGVPRAGGGTEGDGARRAAARAWRPRAARVRGLAVGAVQRLAERRGGDVRRTRRGDRPVRGARWDLPRAGRGRSRGRDVAARVAARLGGAGLGVAPPSARRVRDLAIGQRLPADRLAGGGRLEDAKP